MTVKIEINNGEVKASYNDIYRIIISGNNLVVFQENYILNKYDEKEWDGEEYEFSLNEITYLEINE